MNERIQKAKDELKKLEELDRFLKMTAEAFGEKPIEFMVERFQELFPGNDAVAVALATLVAHYGDGEDISEELALVTSELRKVKLA